MARITHVKAARKTKGQRRCWRCNKDINEGDSYSWVALRVGRMSTRKNFCTEHPPRASDMTTSDKLARLYEAQESVEDALDGDFTRDDVAQALRDAGEAAQEVAQEYEESADNIEEGFGHETQMSEEIREKSSNCEDWSSTLDSAADDVESLDDPDDEDDVKEAAEAHLASEEGDEDYDDELRVEIETEVDRRREEIRNVAENAISELYL